MVHFNDMTDFCREKFEILLGVALVLFPFLILIWESYKFISGGQQDTHAMITRLATQLQQTTEDLATLQARYASNIMLDHRRLKDIEQSNKTLRQQLALSSQSIEEIYFLIDAQKAVLKQQMSSSRQTYATHDETQDDVQKLSKTSNANTEHIQFLGKPHADMRDKMSNHVLRHNEYKERVLPQKYTTESDLENQLRALWTAFETLKTETEINIAERRIADTKLGQLEYWALSINSELSIHLNTGDRLDALEQGIVNLRKTFKVKQDECEKFRNGPCSLEATEEYDFDNVLQEYEGK